MPITGCLFAPIELKAGRRHKVEESLEACHDSPLLPVGSIEAIELIAAQVKACEAVGVEILCCPEAVLGGLADHSRRPAELAIDAASGQLRTVLTPMASATVRGATVLFVPTNNALLPAKGGADIAENARQTDISRARENGMSVVRADVAGRAAGLESYGSSAIVDSNGSTLLGARPLEPDLLVAEIQTLVPARRNRSNIRMEPARAGL